MKDWTPEEVGAFRKKYNLTRKTLSELTGVTISSVYQWERGLKQTSKTVKLLLARIEEDFQLKRKRKWKGKEASHGEKG
jgi:DNA-binding transcriptional regulator YiaG